MKNNQHFSKYLSKLRLEAWVKSILVGLACGFTANFITSFVCWFTPFDGLWLSIGVMAGVALVSSVILYFRVFYPSVTKNAKRLDGLGLEERLVTMIEYEKDDSYIASVQREDAKRALSRLDKKAIKIIVSRATWITVCVSLICGLGMTTVGVLAEEGIILGGDEIIENIIPKEPDVYVSVTYDVEEGGMIEGEADQLVLLGGDATTVIAVPDDGYAFVEWSDGHSKPFRTDTNLEKDLEVFAVFEPEGDGDGDGDGNGDGEGNGDGDGQGNGNGNGNGQGDGEGQGQGNGNGQGEGNDGNGLTGGGKYDEWNQIIDGETYYREVKEEYVDYLKKYLEENRNNLTKEEIEIIEQYIDIV